MSAKEKSLVVVCADIGSIGAGNFAWSCSGPRPTERTSPEGLARFVADQLNKEGAVALGFEAPLWIPLPGDADRLGKARKGEHGRPWSASAGATVLATALAQTTWVLRRIRELLPTKEPPVFLSWSAFDGASAGLFLWEAMVTGKAKTPDHLGDAARAVSTFERALPHRRFPALRTP